MVVTVGWGAFDGSYWDLFGGASRDRTDGLVVANDALSQLSYSPTSGRTNFVILSAWRASCRDVEHS